LEDPFPNHNLPTSKTISRCNESSANEHLDSGTRTLKRPVIQNDFFNRIITALGYDSCWVEGTLLRREREAKEILGVPEEKRLIVLLPIGKAAHAGEQVAKKPMSEVTHYERYGRRAE
jgi:hypothetical protein